MYIYISIYIYIYQLVQPTYTKCFSFQIQFLTVSATSKTFWPIKKHHVSPLVPTLKACFLGWEHLYLRWSGHVCTTGFQGDGGFFLRSLHVKDAKWSWQNPGLANLPIWNLLLQLPIQQLKDLQQCPSVGMAMALQDPSKEVLEDYSANLDTAQGSERNCVSIKSITMYCYVLKSFLMFSVGKLKGAMVTKLGFW